MGELGVMGMTIPEEYGGSGFNAAAYCRMTETVAPLDASASIVDRRPPVHRLQARRPLRERRAEEEVAARPRDREARRRVLPHGARVRARTRAPSRRRPSTTPRRTTYVLNGTKQWISNGGFATFFSVFARIPSEAAEKDKHKEIACFAVVTNPDGTLPGLSRGAEEKKLGLCASSTCQIIFENCRIPAANLIGEKGHGFKFALETLNTGRTVARRRLGRRLEVDDQARGRATRRSASSSSTRIADFEMIRHKITRMTATTYALESMVYLTAGLVDRGIATTRSRAPAARSSAPRSSGRTSTTASRSRAETAS